MGGLVRLPDGLALPWSETRALRVFSASPQSFRAFGSLLAAASAPRWALDSRSRARSSTTFLGLSLTSGVMVLLVLRLRSFLP